MTGGVSLDAGEPVCVTKKRGVGGWFQIYRGVWSVVHINMYIEGPESHTPLGGRPPRGGQYP